MPDVLIRISVFTRINIILGVLALTFAPLLWTWRAIRGGDMDSQSWVVLVLQMVLVQLLLWYAQKRCSSERLKFWHGIAVVAASIRTQWMYTDLLLALLVLPVTIGMSTLLAFTKNPAYKFQRLVHSFYRNRMEQ